MPTESREPLPAHQILSELFPIFQMAGIPCLGLPALTRLRCERLAERLPCHIIPPEGNGETYIRRYGVADLGDGSHIYLQNILRSDGDKALHSHPWPARAFIQAGSYREERRYTSPIGDHEVRHRVYAAGDLNEIESDTFHRLDLLNDESVWTILITGPKVDRQPSWSFWDRDTGVTTGYREFIAAKGYEAKSTPQDLASAARVAPAPDA